MKMEKVLKILPVVFVSPLPFPSSTYGTLQALLVEEPESRNFVCEAGSQNIFLVDWSIQIHSKAEWCGIKGFGFFEWNQSLVPRKTDEVCDFENKKPSPVSISYLESVLSSEE